MTAPRLRLICSALALSIWILPAEIVAQQPRGARAKAREHYKQAIAHEEAKDWARAIAEYEAASALYPDPEFEFLIAEVEVKRGDKEKALERYEKYLAAEPNGRASKQAREVALKSTSTVGVNVYVYGGARGWSLCAEPSRRPSRTPRGSPPADWQGSRSSPKGHDVRSNSSRGEIRGRRPLRVA